MTPEERRRLFIEAREMVRRVRERLRAVGLRLGKHSRAVVAANECAGVETNERERFLRTLGTSGELDQYIEHALAASEGLSRLVESRVLEWSDECRSWVRGSLDEEVQRLEERLEQYYRLLRAAQEEAKRYEYELEKRGSRFDQAQGQAVKKDAPHVPKRAFTEAVERLCEYWKVFSNDQPTRDAIALAFRGLYPRNQLDAARKGKIGNAVNSYFRRLSRSEIKARKAAATSKGGLGSKSLQP